MGEDRIEADSQQLSTYLTKTIMCVSKLRQLMPSDRPEIETVKYQYHWTLTQCSRESNLVARRRLESEVRRGIIDLQRWHSLLLVPRKQLLNM